MVDEKKGKVLDADWIGVAELVDGAANGSELAIASVGVDAIVVWMGAIAACSASIFCKFCNARVTFS